MRLNTTLKKEIDINPIVQPETIIEAQKLITEIYVDEKVEDYIFEFNICNKRSTEIRFERFRWYH